MTGADPFEAFVRRHQDLVFAAAVRLLGSTTEAEDVAQTVFLRAFQRFYLLVSLLFDRSVGASAATLRQKPLTTFGAGLLVLLLLGPVFFLLTVTLIGIAVIPVLMCALLVAALVGKAGAARWIGSRIVSESEPPQRAESLRSVALGLAVIVVAYMIPVLGFVTWTLTSVLGIGAATLAFVSTYRRENPSPALPVPHAVPAPPPLVAADAAWDGEIPPVAVPRPALASAPPVVAAADVVALPRASFRDRFFAFLLDVILVLIARQILDRQAVADAGSDREKSMAIRRRTELAAATAAI